MSRNRVKYLAMLTMFCNHFAYVFLKDGSVLQEVMIDIGYFTAVTMCYFLVEGYHYTRSVKKYALRLLVFGILSQIPFMLALKQKNLNMMFSLFLCLAMIWVKDHIVNTAERNLLTGTLIVCSVWTDWALLAPVFTILFADAYGNRKKVAAAYGKAAGIFLVLNVLSYGQDYGFGTALLHSVCACAGIMVSGIVICIFYDKNRKNDKSKKNDKAGKMVKIGWSKWFFYVFYPAHLLMLWILQFAKVYVWQL